MIYFFDSYLDRTSDDQNRDKTPGDMNKERGEQKPDKEMPGTEKEQRSGSNTPPYKKREQEGDKEENPSRESDKDIEFYPEDKNRGKRDSNLNDYDH